MIMNATIPFVAAAPGHTDMVYLALFGTMPFGLGLLLLTLGLRFVSAAEAALVGGPEAPLGPLG
jgi:hypothetical protein